jgi:type IV pilus assembly protein PilC
MKFIYNARTREGKAQKGTIEASTQKAALEILEKYGFYITNLQEEKKTGLSMEVKIFSGVSDKDLIMLTRQIGTMLKSAIPPLETLRTQVAQTDNNTLREQILKISEAIETGSTLSQAFSMYPSTFNTFYVSIIKSGEATGKVSDSFVYLAGYLEKEYNFKQKVMGAMLYPMFVVIVFLASGIVAIFFIVPKLSELLKNMGGDMPLPTRALIGLGEFMNKGGWILILALLGAIVGGLFYVSKAARFKKSFDSVCLKIPFLSSFLKKFYLVRLAENLAVLIAAGLPITQALKITKDIIGHTVYQEIMSETETRVARGEKISAVFNAHPKEFPAFVAQMVSTGEETGRLDKILMDTVDFYRKEIENTAEQLSTIIEPVLIVTLGLAVGFLAFSVFLPLFKISGGGGM